MSSTTKLFDITSTLTRKLIAEQFPEFNGLPIVEVEKQGHDNRTYRLGNDMLIRMPTMECYALAVEKEQKFLPLLAPHLSLQIPVPIKLGAPSQDYPFHFSVYKWLEGESADTLRLDNSRLEQVALELAKFLKGLQSVDTKGGPTPGLHNWYRGNHISVYDKEARLQITQLTDVIDSNKALKLWQQACQTKWQNPPVWIHGDFAPGNILIQNNKLTAIIDFGCMGVGDPACDLVIAWTFLRDRARDVFINRMTLDEETWLRAKGWALWKAAFELCQLSSKTNDNANAQKRIIDEILS